MDISKKTIIYQRIKRQGFVSKLEDVSDIKAYVDLFRLLQPVSPIFFTRPGDPPRLVHRTLYNDSIIASELRKKHKIVKGRFNGGRVGYVFYEDLETYARTFKKPISQLNYIQEEIIKYVQSTGGVMKEQIKEDLSFLGNKISPNLKRLQEAFILYEDQIDTEWDTGWFNFSSEWFELDENNELDQNAVKRVIHNFIKVFFFSTYKQIQSWSALKEKTIKVALKDLCAEGIIMEASCDGESGYICPEDIDCNDEDIPSFVVMLDKSDFFIRAYMDELKDKYKGKEILQYLLINGEIKGAIEGKWRIGPHNIEDVLLDLSEQEAGNRKEEIIEAIRAYYKEDYSKILKYNSKTFVNNN